MTKYVNKEIGFETVIKFKYTDDEGNTLESNGEMNLGCFLTMKPVREHGLIFEIVKPKKKMYVHEYFSLNEISGDIETVDVRYKLSRETWEEYKKGYNFFLVETREVEVDCD